MKAKLFLSLVVGLFITVGLSAKNPETTTFSNVEVTATGSIKEFTTFTTETNEPVLRSTYKYDLAGNIQEKIVYSWKGNKGWVGTQKLEYAYNESNPSKPSSLTFTKWDEKTNNWSTKSKKVEYDNDGHTTTIDVAN